MSTGQTTMPLETLAIITATLAAVLDQPVGSFAIKSVEPVTAVAAPSMWAKAGVLESHLSRRQFGIRSR